jgi:hypothetical protein
VKENRQLVYLGSSRKEAKKLPKEDREVIEQRLKWAEQVYKDQYGKKNKKN